MHDRRVFSTDQTHDVLRRCKADIAATSEGLGWSSVYASVQREQPFEANFSRWADCLMVLHRSGPVAMTFRSDGRAASRHIVKGGLWFLPAGHECEVSLHASLDTTHIYLRSTLFDAARLADLAPLFGTYDPILQRLAVAISAAVHEGLSNSSLFIDPIAQALASRLQLISGHTMPESINRLSDPQLRRICEFIEANLDTDIRLDAMAEICGLSAKHFVRAFKASLGKPPYQYVLAQRVERAKKLLGDRTQSLSEVALHCGFCHQEHLTRMFRRFTGQTPGRYRDGPN